MQSFESMLKEADVWCANPDALFAKILIEIAFVRSQITLDQYRKI